MDLKLNNQDVVKVYTFSFDLISKKYGNYHLLDF